MLTNSALKNAEFLNVVGIVTMAGRQEMAPTQLPNQGVTGLVPCE
jgi:hypothetical protein